MAQTDLEKLIAAKTKRLTEIPDEFLNRLKKVQKEVLPKVIELIGKLERASDGTILLNKANLQLSADIREMLRVILLNSEYVQAVSVFSAQFDVQEAITNELLQRAFPDFVAGGIASELVAASKRKAVDVFITGITDDAFVNIIKEQVDLAIANNAGFGETVLAIQQMVVGDDQMKGKLEQYAQQIAHDQFALSDRSYTSAVAEDLDAEWFFYSGSEIETTRPFCRERHNQYYYYKEVELWGSGEKTSGLALPNASGDWAGKIDGTNSKTIFTTLGGWNCRHSIIPVSIFVVPKTVIERNIAEGFFTPSDFEVKELGL